MDRPHYANWISTKMIGGCILLTLGLLIAARYTLAVSRLLSAILLILFVPVFLFTFYMLRARTALSYDGGGVQSRVLDLVLQHLNKAGWQGHGKLLDIGCGSGAMDVKAAKRYPKALITGVDYWPGNWDYNQAQCERNAELEGVGGRITFREADAAKLPFLDETFDGAVSNFVFHEVHTQRDKQALIREALRVLKPGAPFAFQDVFFNKRMYGDVNAFVDSLRPYVHDIHFVDTRRPEGAPAFLNTKLVLGEMGMIYGRK